MLPLGDAAAAHGTPEFVGRLVFNKSTGECKPRSIPDNYYFNLKMIFR
jgi:hypothetical protein